MTRVLVTLLTVNLMHYHRLPREGGTPGLCGIIRGLYGDFATHFCLCCGGNVGT